MSDFKKKQFIGLINYYNVLLIEDDIYGDFNFIGNCLKLIKFFDIQGLVLYCLFISKILLFGLRIGWVVLGCYQIKVE